MVLHFNLKDYSVFSVCAYVYMYLRLVAWNWVISISESTDMGAETWIPVPISQHMFLAKEPSLEHPDSVLLLHCQHGGN